MATALYIGCGYDFDPVKTLVSVRNFIFIDSLPYCNNGDMYRELKIGNVLYSKSYMLDFSNKAKQSGFLKISIDGVYPHVYKNYNTHQQIFHYFSLIFPFVSLKMNHYADKNELEKLIFLLNDVNYLIVRRYQPHYSIFKFFVRPIIIVSYSDTIWTENVDELLNYEKEKLHIYLQNNNMIRNNIDKYLYVNENGIIQHYDCYNDFIKANSY